MAAVALAAPTLTLGGQTAALGLISAGTALTSATGLTLAGNNGLLVVNITTIASGGMSNLVLTAPNSANNSASITLAASSIYWLGPFDPAIFNWPTGASAQSGVTVANLVYITGTFGAVANTAQVFYIPASRATAGYQTLHNPFDGGTAGNQDY